MSDLFRRVLLPVASEEDAETSARALRPYLEATSQVVAVHVIEKAGGAPDKASVEQREEYAEEIFATVEGELADTPLDTLQRDLRFDTEVEDAIFEAANEHDASVIAFTPRGGSRWIQLLTGDVTLHLVTETDRPVVVLPDTGETVDAVDESAPDGDGIDEADGDGIDEADGDGIDETDGDDN